MKIKFFQGLFVKAVLVLSLISIVPVLFIGYRIMRTNNRLLTNELLQKQQMIAVRLASTVRNALTIKEQLLAEFADLHTDFGSYPLINQKDLDSLRFRHPSLFYAAAFSIQGKKIFDTGTVPQQGDYLQVLHSMNLQLIYNQMTVQMLVNMVLNYH